MNTESTVIGWRRFRVTNLANEVPSTISNRPVSEVSTKEEFAYFLNENGAKIEETVGTLSLYICGSGSKTVRTRLLPDPDPTTQISIYIQSDKSDCSFEMNLPDYIIIRGPLSSVKIPRDLLTREAILHAFKISGQGTGFCWGTYQER